ncbi:hypothetical protein MTO96_036507 [Rhipicephalus appendiculatus]
MPPPRTCVFVVSCITAFLKLSLESVLPMVPAAARLVLCGRRAPRRRRQVTNAHAASQRTPPEKRNQLRYAAATAAERCADDSGVIYGA